MKKSLKIGMIILLVISIVVITSFLVGYFYLKSKLSLATFKELDYDDLGIEKTINDGKVIIDETIKFAIFGSDSRDEDNQYAGRSDAIIIVSMNTTKKTISLISIPRDSYVNVPGYGYTKINHAYAYGQEQLSLKTINTNFGLDIDQYITIDFSGLVNVVDFLGGVELNLSQEEVNFINARTTGNKLSASGTMTLNGTQALIHSRNRYVGNDFYRTSRQRDIMIALMEKISKKSPTEILNMSDVILSNVTTNMNIDKYTNMFKKLSGDIKTYSGNVKSVQIPSTEYGYDQMIGGIYYFGFDMDIAKQDFQSVIYGD